MRVVVTVPLPLDDTATWQQFKPMLVRFCESWREFPPGISCECWAICNNNEPDAQAVAFFHGINTRFVHYHGYGCDLGGQQYSATLLDEAFMICCTSRTYFHRAGWGTAMVDAIASKGDALYGAFASLEGGVLHLRTPFHALLAATLRKYPWKVRSKEDGTRCEVGDWCLTRWFQQTGRGAYLVTWDGVWAPEDWRKPENIFRRGDQSNCLAWDKHSELWQAASAEEKARLSRMADEGIDG